MRVNTGAARHPGVTGRYGRRGMQRAGASWYGLSAFIGVLLSLPGCGAGWLVEGSAWLEADKEAGAALLTPADGETRTFTVELAGAGDYARVDLGASAAGDQWTLEARPGTETVVLALLDGDDHLLWRDRVRRGVQVRHTLRADAAQLHVGVQVDVPGPTSAEIVATRRENQPVPPPRAQTVWLNFTGARDVQIGDQPALTFGPFDAADLGASYADATGLVKAEITRIVRAQYAEFDVTILSSDDGPPPAGDYTTVYFGGGSATYLGMGAGVDRYNENPNDCAIVFTQAFAAYETMDLSAEQMARMVGNTAAHELGHLLGLYHTRGSGQLMDDSRSAWELAGESEFGRAPLAETVFPIGADDSVEMLTAAVGLAQS